MENVFKYNEWKMSLNTKNGKCLGVSSENIFRNLSKAFIPLFKISFRAIVKLPEELNTIPK
jgi:hypothetical protein